jgi:hypothetical protein
VFERVQHGFGLGPSMSFRETHHDVASGVSQSSSLGQHRKGLPGPRSDTEEDM